MAELTASLIRLEDLVKYSVSNDDTERRTSTASGLRTHQQRMSRPNECSSSPLLIPGIHCIGVDSDFGEEIVKETK